MGCIGYVLGWLSFGIIGSRLVGEDQVGLLILLSFVVGGPLGAGILKAITKSGNSGGPPLPSCPKCHGRGMYMGYGQSASWFKCDCR